MESLGSHLSFSQPQLSLDIDCEKSGVKMIVGIEHIPERSVTAM